MRGLSSLGKKPCILQIVGYQNSGKTTAAGNIIRYLTQRGYKVGSFKHHGHGGTPRLPEDKDSTRLLEAGAVLSGVSGGGVFALSTSLPLNWIDLCRWLDIDVLLIEGYKQKDYDKIVCIRGRDEIDLLKKLSHVEAIVSWIPLPDEKNVFSIDDRRYCEWVARYIENKRKG
ncbi:molybdopterin-guanine dinucleotide biosynthesis protein B [Sporolactobacillus sp. THM7-4]|nr:molybdopterin-guanine dinucleotide biosynthesis protein B [Sporolactobacillus sp. THM7-4]